MCELDLHDPLVGMPVPPYLLGVDECPQPVDVQVHVVGPRQAQRVDP